MNHREWQCCIAWLCWCAVKLHLLTHLCSFLTWLFRSLCCCWLWLCLVVSISVKWLAGMIVSVMCGVGQLSATRLSWFLSRWNGRRCVSPRTPLEHLLSYDLVRSKREYCQNCSLVVVVVETHGYWFLWSLLQRLWNVKFLADRTYYRRAYMYATCRPLLSVCLSVRKVLWKVLWLNGVS